MKALTLLSLSLIFSSSLASAASYIQCRGIDGNREQIAVQVNGITEKDTNNLRGKMQVVTSYGWKTLCESALVVGIKDKVPSEDRSGDLYAECDSKHSDNESVLKGLYFLNLEKKGYNAYQGRFCGEGKGTKIGKMEFVDEDCVVLDCRINRALK